MGVWPMGNRITGPDEALKYRGGMLAGAVQSRSLYLAISTYAPSSAPAA